MSAHKLKNIFVQGAIAPSFISESLAAHQSKTNIGAHSMFLGQVRADAKNGAEVMAIEYTCYEEIALKQMSIIREAIFEKYPLTCLHVYHSIGKVNTGEICLFVFASSAHRKAAVEACSDTVERIKAELPVWGREIFDNNETQWKINT